jgi:hypothetical protein
MLNIFCLIVLLLLFALSVRVFWSANDANWLVARDIATAADRAVHDYRQRLVPLLALAAVLTLFGVASPLLAPLALQQIWPLRETFLEQMPLTVWLLIARLAWAGTALGLGHSLLAYAAACALADDYAGRSLKALGAALLRDWKGTLLLAIPLSVPSLLVTLAISMYSIAFVEQAANFSARSSLFPLAVFGVPLLLITALIIALRWSLAPTVMFYEALGPIAALRRSAKIVQAQRSGMFNLWLIGGLIGWLMVSVPASTILTLLRWVVLPTPELIGRFAVLIWALGSIFVAPLLALGPVELYLSLHARTANLSQRIESWEAEHQERGKVAVL